MSTRWREPSCPAEAIAKAWLEERDKDALYIVEEILGNTNAKHDQLDIALGILDEEGSADAMVELAEAMLVLAEATEDGCLLAFPFDADRTPSGASLRLSLLPLLGGSLVLHAKPLDPLALLELSAYSLRAVLSSLLAGRLSPGLVTAHDGNGLSVFIGALKGNLEDVNDTLVKWLCEHGHALGCGLPCPPSGLHQVLDAMEARSSVRKRSEAELADFLRIATEESGGPVTLSTSVRDGIPWATALSASGAVVDELIFRNLPILKAKPHDDEVTPSGRRMTERSGLRVIRGGRE